MSKGVVFVFVRQARHGDHVDGLCVYLCRHRLVPSNDPIQETIDIDSQWFSRGYYAEQVLGQSMISFPLLSWFGNPGCLTDLLVMCSCVVACVDGLEQEFIVVRNTRACHVVQILQHARSLQWQLSNSSDSIGLIRHISPQVR